MAVDTHHLQMIGRKPPLLLCKDRRPVRIEDRLWQNLSQLRTPYWILVRHRKEALDMTITGRDFPSFGCRFSYELLILDEFFKEWGRLLFYVG